MRLKMAAWGLAAFGLLTVCSCGRSQAPSLNLLDRSLTNETSAPLADTQTLTVMAWSGQPIAGAQVLIGTANGAPFSGNFVTTDSAGHLTVPAAWTSALPVTVNATGFVRTTYTNVMPVTQTILLRPAPIPVPLVLSGATTGFGDMPQDGYLHIGLVYPALTRADANIAQLENLISTSFDQISVIGKTANVPSNMTIPNQTQSYIFVPITFDKPLYRFAFPEIGQWKIATGHVRFEMKTVLREIVRGKSFFDVLNDLEFKSAAVRDIPITGNLSQDLPVNDIPLQPSFQITAPNYPSELSMFSLSMAESGGFYYVSDAKRPEPGSSVTLAAPPGAKGGLIVSLLRHTTGSGAVLDDLSSVTQPAGTSQAIDFLPVPKHPLFVSQTLTLDPPQATVTTIPSGTVAVLSKIDQMVLGNGTLEVKTPEWEIYSSAWEKTLALPNFPGAALPLIKTNNGDNDGNGHNQSGHRWTVLFAGRDPGSNAPPTGPASLINVNHVARSGVDF